MKARSLKSLFFFSILVAVLSSCSQEDEVTYKMNTNLVELRCRKTFALEVIPALQGVSYTSLNTNIATVSSSGVVTAKLVGSTKVVVKDSLNRMSDTVNVVVSSVHTVFSDPYFGFGASERTVRSAVNKPLMQWLDYRGSTGYALVFEAEDSYESLWIYMFDDEQKYVSAEVLVPQMDYLELDQHLKDRYLYVGSRTYYLSSSLESEAMSVVDTYYVNPDSTLIVVDDRISANQGTWITFNKGSKESVKQLAIALSNPDLYSVKRK